MAKTERDLETEQVWPTAWLNVQKLHPDAIVPTRNNETDAGLDLYSNEDVTLAPRGFVPFAHVDDTDGRDQARTIVSTGIAVEFPPGYAFFIHDRSGLSAKFGIHRVAGVVDYGYSGEVKVALINLSAEQYKIKKGDRIAQGVLTPVATPKVNVVEQLSKTSRGAKGFGSSGK